MFDWLKKLVSSNDKADPAPPVADPRSMAPGGFAAPRAGAKEPASPVSRMILLDRNGNIIGYEFVSHSGVFGASGGDARHQKAHDQMLLRTVLGIGAERIAQFREIWLTVSESALGDALLEGMPASASVVLLRTSGHAVPGDELLAQVAALKSKGFRFGLASMPGLEVFNAWLPLIDVVALDINAYAPDELDEALVMFRASKPGLLVLARRIDSYEEYEYCLGKGFSLFSGKFLTHRESWPPQPPLHPDRTRLCQLLNELRGGAELVDIAAGLKFSPELSYRFLRYINSAGMGTANNIGSLEQGVLYLGREKLYRWLTLLLFSGADGQLTDAALLEQALARGRTLELMAGAKLSRVQCDEAFVVGVFSLLDMLLRVPMDVALRPLKLPPPVLQALLERQGPYAGYLELAKIGEEGEAGQSTAEASVVALAGELGLSLEQVNRFHVEALTWVQQLQHGQSADALA